MTLPEYLAAFATALTVLALLAIAAIIAGDGGDKHNGWQDGHLDELDDMLTTGEYVGRHRVPGTFSATTYRPVYRPEFARLLSDPRARRMVTA